ncbi:alpha/beta hydrolase [Marinomonas aquiplantarum]|uniref:Acetyl esterase/lipase n=1 Tax=Marinomonas aquiplantarum TaxID=491951 RepID=A0A366D8H9_9GAMM|nr:alpha/beta hydrolase [Marinomonas aquiplantarum]RBO86340.1 acetyl esterase/lipase [Marinomonas aquiplantarum]
MKPLWSLLALSIGLNAWAAAPIIPAEPASYDDFPYSRVVIDGMESLDAKRLRRSLNTVFNVTYAHKSGRDLKLHIIRPVLREALGEKASTTTFPIIVYVQGSAWFKQDLGLSMAQLSRFAERGYVVAMVEYRPSPVAPFPAQVEDTKSAIHFITEHAEEYYGDANNIIVWGDSSGGHTAAMVGATLDTRDFDDVSKSAIKLKAVIDYYGPTALDQMNEEPSTYDHIQANSPEGMLLGGVNVLNNRDKAKLASPMHYISANEDMPPFLILHGDKDRLVPFGQSVKLFARLQQDGHQARLIRLHGADHGRAPFWQDEVLNIVDQFIRKALAAGPRGAQG